MIAALALQLTACVVFAEETNTLEIIKQLQKRVEELERKLQSVQTTNRSSDLLKQNEELDQRVKILERNRELEHEAAESKAKEAPRLTVGSDGFGFSSADGSFGIELRGLLQVDSRTFFDDGGVGNDGFLLRRVRPILQGTVWRDFDFLFVPEFGGSGDPQIVDAYLNYRYQPPLQLQIGKFKSPIGLEQLQSDRDNFFNERSLVTGLVPNRDLGAMLHGEVWDGFFNYAAGIFNGVGDARSSTSSDFDDNKSGQGRVFFHPFKNLDAAALQGLGIGLSGSYQDLEDAGAVGLPSTTGGTLPGYFTEGQQQFFAYNPTNGVVEADGEHWRLSPQAYYHYGPFGFLAEYAISNQRVSRSDDPAVVSERLDHRGWQIAGSWILTGEDASFKAVVPRNPFNPRQGGWGAFELVARYSELDIDDSAFPFFSNASTSASKAAAWSVGLNWYLNKNVLVKASYSYTDFTGGGAGGSTAPGSITSQDEQVFFTRMQLAF